MILLQIVVIIVKSPILLAGYFLKHPKMIVSVAILGIIGVVYVNFVSQKPTPSVDIPTYQIDAPPVSQAPYVYDTPGRMYYVVQAVQKDGYVWLEKFYSYDNGKWNSQDTPLPLRPQDVKVYNR